MKQCLIAIFVIYGLIACTDSRDVRPQKQDVPKALEENSLSELATNRGDGDLVNSIYSELIKNSPSLSEVERQIREVRQSTDDSLLVFNAFDGKNQQYYLSARRQLATVKDSALKDLIELLVDSSAARYQSAMLKHNALLKAISLKSSELSDLYVLLKISKTLPVIEDYQKKNIPATKPIENLITDFDRAIEKTKSLTRNPNGS